MTQVTERPGTASARPARDRRWLRWGAIVLAADLVFHAGGGTLSNDWEGWGVFWSNVLFVLITGVIIVGTTYGLVARWALRRSHAAGAALGTGIASLAGYAIVFTWAPVLIAPAAFLLARAALRSDPPPGGRRMARTGAVFAVATFAVFVWFVVTAIVTGSLPNLPFLGPLNPAL
jgi:hypothetical protein